MELPLTVFHNASVSQNWINYWVKNIFVLKPVQNKHLCIQFTIEILFSLIIWVSQEKSLFPSMISVVNSGFSCPSNSANLGFIRVLEIPWRWSEFATTACVRKYLFFSKLVRVCSIDFHYSKIYPPPVPSLRSPDVQFGSYNAGCLKRFCC
jgi:hypothetical protein